MATVLNIADFHHGETLVITLSAKNPDGSVITNAANQTVTWQISNKEDGPAVLSFDTAPQVVLQDAPTGVWDLSLQFADYNTFLRETKTYYYNVWTTDLSGTNLLQVKGTLAMGSSINPAE